MDEYMNTQMDTSMTYPLLKLPDAALENAVYKSMDKYMNTYMDTSMIHSLPDAAWENAVYK